MSKSKLIQFQLARNAALWATIPAMLFAGSSLWNSTAEIGLFDLVVAACKAMGVVAGCAAIASVAFLGTTEGTVEEQTAIESPKEIPTETPAPSLDERAVKLTELQAARDELAQARLDALASSRAKDAFLLHMSHEVRTPMTAILGNVSMLDEPDITPKQRASLLRSIRISADHLLGLINDLLDLSQIESGSVAIQPKPISPVQIFEEAVSLMRPRAIAKGIVINAEPAYPLPRQINADPLRLRQILLNLIANAVRYTSSGGIRIGLACDLSNPEFPLLRFDVADTGEGIEATRIADLFEPFNPLGGSPGDSAGRAGVGLAISQRLAALMNARLDVVSTPGVGSVFSLVFPIDVAQAANLTQGRSEATTKPVEAAASALDKARILYCEDGVDNQRLVKFMLSKAGATVTLADNGRVGIDAFVAAQKEGAPFDLVLMDMQMPEMDGYSATAELRRLGFDTPVLALTAHAMTGDRERCLAAGCDDYATKPIDRTGLITMCASWRTQRSARTLSAQGPDISQAA